MACGFTSADMTYDSSQHNGDGRRESILGRTLGDEGQLTTWRTWRVRSCEMKCKLTYWTKEKAFWVFPKGQYSFAIRWARLSSFQAPSSILPARSGASPEHTAASVALDAFIGTTQPSLEKIGPAQEASYAKCTVIFRKQVNSYKAL